MPKKRREFRRFDDLKGLNDAPEPFFRARSDFEGPGARKPPKSTNNCKNIDTISKTNNKPKNKPINTAGIIEIIILNKYL